MATKTPNELPQVNSLLKVVLMNVNIQLGALNIGYVLSYLTLTIDTLFANLGIPPEEKTSNLSLMNGILPLGCVVGVIIAYFLKKKFTNKQCIHIADFIGVFSLLATITNTNVIIIFRFLLGVANGISSLIMPVYVKSLCPERYYGQISMILGYGVNTGLAIGQLMGIGYIEYHGATSNWWRIVFAVPALIFIIRSSIIHFVFNYDSPEQLILKGNEEQAKYIICIIYKEEYREQEFKRYQNLAQIHHEKSFFHIFTKQKLIGLQVGIISMFVQIWCGSFAVFYYSAQIFQQLSDGDLVLQTIYTFCIGLFSVAAQFTTIPMLPKLGSKYIIILGALSMGGVNAAIAILSNYSDNTILFIIFILLVLLIMIFAATLSPICWSIVPQLNDSDGTFFTMDLRWIFQTILIFMFPYIIKGIQIAGAFYLFAAINFSYVIYTHFFIIDNRGKTNNQLMDLYYQKYGQFQILPQSQQN